MKIDSSSLPAHVPPHQIPPAVDPAKIERLIELLQAAQRPVLLVGHGIRASNALPDLQRLVSVLGIPVLCSRRGADLLADNHPLHFGRPGTYGQRSANLIIQNSDLLLCLGSRLSLPLVGRNFRAFARAATKVVVDIDPDELGKSTVSPDIAIASDAGFFIRCLLENLRGKTLPVCTWWLSRCTAWRNDFSPRNEHPKPSTSGINPYRMLEALSEHLPDGAIVLAEGGPCVDFAMQSFRFKEGQRFVSSSGLETSGFALSGAIGAALADRKNRIVCVCESSGFLQNIAEASAIAQHQLPAMVFILCSATDPRLRLLQTGYFGGRRIEATPQNDTADQTLKIFSQLYQTPTYMAYREEELPNIVAQMSSSNGPSICAVHMPDDFELAPRLALTAKPDGTWTSAPLEDMSPLLPRDIFRAQMIIPPLDEIPT